MVFINDKRIWSIFEKCFDEDFNFLDYFAKRTVITENLKAKLLKCAYCCNKEIKELEKIEKLENERLSADS